MMKLLRNKMLTGLINFSRGIAVSAIAVFIHEGSFAQEALGIMNSNYTGVNRLWINPANAALSRHSVSLNFLAGDGFFVSNYFYVHRKDYGFLKLFRVDYNDPKYAYTYEYPEFTFADTVHYVDYYKNNSPKNLFLNARIAGPSILLKAGDNYFSFVSGFRSNFSGSVIPYDAANFGYRGLDFIPQQDITYEDKNFDISMLSWFELGLGYSRTFYKDEKNKLSAGLTLKYLLGTAAAYGIAKNATYMVPYQDTLNVYDMNSTIGMALPIDYATNEFNLSPLVKGMGFSGDVGIVYQRLSKRPSTSALLSLRENRWEENYIFRAGVSLLDAGFVRFSKTVQVHSFENVNNRVWPGLIDFKAESIQHFLRSASYNLLGDSLASLTDQASFRMWLPAAFSAQLDYNFGNGIYVNASYVQATQFGKPNVRRETLLALTPRYETPDWEVNLPVSLVDFQHPAIGLSFRIYSLVVGTEKLGTFLHATNVRGMDLYFSLGINLNTKEKTGGGVSKGRYSGGRGKGCESLREYKRYQVH